METQISNSERDRFEQVSYQEDQKIKVSISSLQMI